MTNRQEQEETKKENKQKMTRDRLAAIIMTL